MTAPAAPTATTKAKPGGQPDWLLPTKLTAPPPRPQLVSRPRLMRRLDGALRHPLTLIAAPAGFGKTTLIGAWRASVALDGLPSAWLSLDEADDEPVRFWSYVLAAVQRVRPGIGDAALASLRSPQPPPIDSVLAALLRDLAAADAELVLILDDYHVVTQEAIHRQLAFVVDHLPSNVHLVLSGRSDPPLPLARLRARNLLLEVGAGDLRFIGEEVAAFLRDAMSLDLSAELVAALDNATEGWATGLQLAGLSLQRRADPHAFITSFTGSHHYVVDYLVEEVLQQQSARVQAFLLRTAILERLTGPLCDAMTGEGDGQSMLELIERSNLFLYPLDEERRWFRYHRLFADVLRQRLPQTQLNIADLHRQAARWLADNGFTEPAIGHALEAADHDQVAGLVEVAGRRLLQRGELATLGSWLTRLPPGLVRSRPRLALLQAWVAWVSVSSSDQPSTVDARRNVVASWVEDAERRLGASTPGPAEIGPSEVAALQGEAAVLRSHLARSSGDVDSATELSQEALNHVPADEGWVRGHLLFTLGTAAYWRGDVHPLINPEADDIHGVPMRSSSSSTAWSTNFVETSPRATAFATLTVGDLTAASRWYRHVLGFELVSERPGLNGLPILVHLRRAHDQDLVLMATGSELPGSGNRPGDGITLTFVVEDDVDALATRAEATGARLVEGPLDRPGQIREVTLYDADGYRLKFVRRASGNRSSWSAE